MDELQRYQQMENQCQMLQNEIQMKDSEVCLNHDVCALSKGFLHSIALALKAILLFFHQSIVRGCICFLRRQYLLNAAITLPVFI